MRPRIAIGATLALLAGCSDWPPPGQGGAAEIRMPTLLADAAHPADFTARRSLDCALARFEALRTQAETRGRLGGTVTLVGVTAAQAQREYAGLLRADAGQTAARLDREVAEALALEPGLAVPPQPACT